MPRIAIIDFETTGMSPDEGSRATEVGIVMIEGGRVVDRFQSLMNTGAYVSPFITQLTGITNAMVEAAPPAGRVMREAARFVGGAPMVAHNASFDRKFWVDELARVDEDAPQPFACTVLLARRLYPQAPNHRLGTLAAWLHLPPAGRAHRALADAETAAALLLQILHDLRTRHGVPAPDHALLMALQRCARAKLGALLRPMATV
jgi:DNA polymerase III subunit epsilon